MPLLDAILASGHQPFAYDRIRLIDDIGAAQCDDESFSFIWISIVAHQTCNHLSRSAASGLHIFNVMPFREVANVDT